jgi:hypothetical protein
MYIGSIAVHLYSFLTLTLDGVSGQCDATAALPPGHNPITHLAEGWVDPRTVMDSLENWKLLPPIGIWIPDHLSIAQSPYILTIPAPAASLYRFFIWLPGHRISRNIYTSDTHKQYFPVYHCANSSLPTTASGPSSPQLPCLIKWISRTISVTAGSFQWPVQADLWAKSYHKVFFILQCDAA